MLISAFLYPAVSPYKAPKKPTDLWTHQNQFPCILGSAPGDVRGYKVTFHPSGNDVDLGEYLVGPLWQHSCSRGTQVMFSINLNVYLNIKMLIILLVLSWHIWFQFYPSFTELELNTPWLFLACLMEVKVGLWTGRRRPPSLMHLNLLILMSLV